MNQKGSIAPILLGLPVGLLIGLGVYTFGYARGASYMTDDPAACANCHVMKAQYDGWKRSSHHQIAVCNDCHAPDGLVAKYFTKALNGFNHSLAFTSGRFPDDIIITPRNHRVADEACMKCHDDLTSGIRATRHEGDSPSCTTCHRNVGHAH
ncbi:MAG: cytochrome c nitrite reductase small subunit [Candidatus Solibacter usitatus]|nr:cytochrome c nitrite reductase small subunit [Candidatus Solibacter usitatus]